MESAFWNPSAGAGRFGSCVLAAGALLLAFHPLLWLVQTWVSPVYPSGGAYVDTLLALLEKYLRVEMRRCLSNSIRLRVIGRRDRLPGLLQLGVARAEARTASGTRMLLRIAVDYSARDAILKAAAERREAGREGFAASLARVIHGGEARDVDLVIRTGGEQRLSDFLLWESAYAELYFTDRTWPDFDGDDLAKALAWFRGRERRFGVLAEAPPVLEMLSGRGAR